MAPRRRRITDLDIADRACGLLVGGGPEAVTFAEVAKLCGLAAPTLVQRFGTRDAMLAATAAALRARVTAVFMGADATTPRLAVLRDCLNQLAPLQAAATLTAPTVDLSAYSLEVRKQISYALAWALEAGELPRCDVAQLARAIQINFAGAVATALLERRAAEREITTAFDLQFADYV